MCEGKMHDLIVDNTIKYLRKIKIIATKDNQQNKIFSRQKPTMYNALSRYYYGSAEAKNSQVFDDLTAGFNAVDMDKIKAAGL